MFYLLLVHLTIGSADDSKISNFRIESDNQYESNVESDVRFEIESNHEASQVPTADGADVVLTDTRHLVITHSILNLQSSQHF